MPEVTLPRFFIEFAMNAITLLSSPFRALLCTAIAVGIAPAQGNPNLTLRLPDLVALPGQTVTVPVLFDNSLGDVQGWSFSCNITAPLQIATATAGTTTAALQSGAGPDFFSSQIYPGLGFAVGCVVSFFSLETVPIGSNYELNTCQVVVPANAVPGTVYTLGFDGPAIGTPPVATVIVLAGASFTPTMVAGSITVGASASVTPVASSDCPVAPMGNLASLNTPGFGVNWDLQVQGIPAGATHGFYIFGWTLQPVSMAAFGSPCTLQVAPDLLGFALTSGSNLQSYTFVIPNVPALQGAEIFVQATHDGAPTPPFSSFLGLPSAYYFTNTLKGAIGL
jgi:hypothetical protein